MIIVIYVHSSSNSDLLLSSGLDLYFFPIRQGRARFMAFVWGNR